MSQHTDATKISRGNWAVVRHGGGEPTRPHLRGKPFGLYLTGGDGDHTHGCEAAITAMRLIRAIKAQAWEEGAESAFYEPEIRGQVDYPDNPYEEQA